MVRVAAAAFAVSVVCGAADKPTFQTTVSLVRADVFVFDRHSRAPVLDLQASDFTVLDGGQPREIAYFSDDSGPVDLVFLLDVSGSVREILPGVAGAAAGALGALDREDRAAVMAFSKTTVLTQNFTGEVDAVAQGIRTAAAISIGLDTDINQALWSAANYLHRAESTRRRAILILTDNLQETHVPDALVDEQLSECGAVLDGFLLHGPIALPHVTIPGFWGLPVIRAAKSWKGINPPRASPT
jgi:VWFA-related protein